MCACTSKEDDRLQAQKIIPISLHLQSSLKLHNPSWPLNLAAKAPDCAMLQWAVSGFTGAGTKADILGVEEGTHIRLVGDQMLVGHRRVFGLTDISDNTQPEFKQT